MIKVNVLNALSGLFLTTANVSLLVIFARVGVSLMGNA